MSNENPFLDKEGWSVFGEKEGEKDKPRHEKARAEKGTKYPDRFPVPDGLVRWDKEYAEYAPVYFVSPRVIENDERNKPTDYEGREKFWAQPEDIALVDRERIQSYESLSFDEKGRPMNPHGRTGMEGRGLLGKWGANFAADNIITRPTEDGTGVEVFLIRRSGKDSSEGMLAFPAGMTDKDETSAESARREFEEETGIPPMGTPGEIVYRGYVDDPRNTDNAWIESTFFHSHFSREETSTIVGNTEGNEEVQETGWFTVTPQLIAGMAASHGKMLELALKGV